MLTAAAKTIAIAVVTSGNDIEQPAGRTTVRVIVDREEIAEGVKAEMKRIPIACRYAGESAAIGTNPVNAASLAAAGEGLSIAADELVGRAVVLSHAEENRTERINLEA